jgi:hypothetical protein
VTLVLDALLVVLEVLNAVPTEGAAQAVTLTITKVIPPLLDLTEHESATFTSAIITVLTKSWVVENTVDNAVKSAGNIGVVVIPAFHDLRDDPLQHSTSDLASRLVEYVTEVIL